jgi:hypothetical protein
MPWMLLWKFRGFIAAGFLILAVLGGLAYVRHLQLDHVRLTAERDQWRSAAAGWKASFAAAEANRKIESANATNAATDAEKACDARIASRVKAAQAARTIINAPVKIDPRGCAVRELAAPDLVRDALAGPH